MLRTVRMWCGKISYKVTGKLIRDTGTGLIVENAEGVRFFAPTRDVLDSDDLFSPLKGC